MKVFYGKVKITKERSVLVESNGDSNTINAKNIIIATGARPR